MSYPTWKPTRPPDPASRPPLRRRAKGPRHMGVTVGLLTLAALTLVMALGIVTQSGPFTLLKGTSSQPTSRVEDRPKPTPRAQPAISAGGGISQPAPEPGQQAAVTPAPVPPAAPPADSSQAPPADSSQAPPPANSPTSAPQPAAGAPAAPASQSAPPQSAPPPSPTRPTITVPLPVLGSVDVQVP